MTRAVAILYIAAILILATASRPAPSDPDARFAVDDALDLDADRGTVPSPDAAPPSAIPVASAAAPSGVSVSGISSWYGTGPDCLCAAAGPALRVGDWRGRLVTVTAGGRSIVVKLIDYCGCLRGTDRERVIDLSDEAFSELARLSRGLVRVEVAW